MKEVYGCDYKGNKRFFCGDGTVFYSDCGSGYMNLYWGSYGIHTYTHTT